MGYSRPGAVRGSGQLYVEGHGLVHRDKLQATRNRVHKRNSAEQLAHSQRPAKVKPARSGARIKQKAPASPPAGA